MSRFSVIPLSAILDKRLTLRDLSVIAAIGSHTDKNGWCYPSLARIGQMLGISRQAVQKSMRHLKEHGYLQIVAQFSGKAQVVNNTRVLFDAIQPEEFQRGITDPATLIVSPPQLNAVAPLQPLEVAPPATPEVAQTSHLNVPYNVKIAPPDGDAEKVFTEKPPRPRDLLWEAVITACGLDGGTPTDRERKAWNGAVKSLREARATPGEVTARAACYRARWPHVSLTPTALARRWTECVATIEERP